MAGELENNDTVSEEKMPDAEYITMLESELDVKLAKVKSFEVVSVFLISISALCFIFYSIVTYGS